MKDRQHPFPFDVEANHVMQAFGREVKALLRLEQETFVDPNNIQRFQHGSAWQSHQSHNPDQVSKLSSHEHRIDIKFEDIVLGRISIVQEKIRELATAMSDSFTATMITTLSETCETHGNVVHGGQGPAKAFMDMLEKVEFGVNRNGEVSLPQILGGVGLSEIITSDKTMNSEEYITKINKITEQKSKEALQKEVSRKAKFLKKSD
ncbi:hypothetical protein LJR232_002499 [Aquipseudomonas alcaligenes]